MSEEAKKRIGHYIDNGDGTVTDTRTGLTWMRCAMGQIWEGKTCQGEAKKYKWDEAIKLRHTFTGYDDWRLPDIDELKTLIDTSHGRPTIDNLAFPNTPQPASFFWSSSPSDIRSGDSWGVSFSDGLVSNGYKAYRFDVRLVRGGQCLGSMAETTPQPSPAKALPEDKFPPNHDEFEKSPSYIDQGWAAKIKTHLNTLLSQVKTKRVLGVASREQKGQDGLSCETINPDGIKSNTLKTSEPASLEEILSLADHSDSLIRIGHYIDNGDGTVTDTCTGLMWMRYAMGQTWNGKTCQGEARNYTWDEAKILHHTLAGYDDWRLPDINELKTLIDTSQGSPTIDQTAFRNAPRSRFWSSSPYRNSSYYMWIVSFSSGSSYGHGQPNYGSVRLVRGSQCLGSLEKRPMEPLSNKALQLLDVPRKPDAVQPNVTPPPEPTISEENKYSTGASDSPISIGHYTDNGDGTVADTRTGLMWMRCAMGQTWDGKNCQGKVKDYTWDEAMELRHTFAGHDDWRLPDIDELKTLINQNQDNFAIENTAFPGTYRLQRFWSSSPGANNSFNARYVNFSHGNVYNDPKGSSFNIRLVRGGQHLGLKERTPQSSPAKMPQRFIATLVAVNQAKKNPPEPMVSEKTISQADPSDSPIRIGHYTDNGDGTVTDTRTALMWMRSAMGQTWDGQTSHGNAQDYTWDEAKELHQTYAGYDDWRLPDIDELKMLIDRSQDNQTIDNTAFPCTPRSGFWSSSTNVNYLDSAWYVYFGSGKTSYGNKDNNFAVRFVRGGQGLDYLGEKPMSSSAAKTLPVVNLPPPKPTASEETKSLAGLSDSRTHNGHYIDNDTVTDTSMDESRKTSKNEILSFFDTEHTPQDCVEYINGISRKTINGISRPTKSSWIRAFVDHFHDVFPKLQLVATTGYNNTIKYNLTERILLPPQARDLQIMHVLLERYPDLFAHGVDYQTLHDSVILKVMAQESLMLTKAAVHLAIDHLRQNPALFAAEIAELRVLLGATTTELAVAPLEMGSEEPTLPGSLPLVLSWLANQDRVSLADLRRRLLPLDLFPGAVIDDINERALDFVDEPALEEDGDSVIVFREVLLQVIAAWQDLSPMDS